MHDDGGHSGGRSTPPALSAAGEGASAQGGEYAVVPADQLLDVAAALSAGATRLHDQLRHLRPEDRNAVLDAVADQLSEIVSLFTSLVRGVVTAGTTQEQRTSGGASDETGATSGDDSAEPRLAVVAPERSSPPVAVLVEPFPAEPSEGGSSGDPHAHEPVPAVHINPYRRPVPVGAETPAPLESLTRDELTGVLTRQAGFAALTKEIDRCRYGGDRFVLGYLDVDGLQSVNDERGPRAGDELLRKVTAALRATLRSYDVICRLGGDEFLFSLPGADMATAELRFKEFAVILAEEAPGGSASVGFAQLRENDTIDDLIARADTALLKSRRGRRRTSR